MKKIILIFICAILLCGCNSKKELMTFDEMLECPNVNVKLRSDILSAEMNLNDIQKEDKNFVLLEDNKCQIILTVTYDKENEYFLHFDFVEYATEYGYITYTLQGYDPNAGVMDPPNDIHVTLRSSSNEVTTNISYYSKDLENVPDVTYRVKLTDDIISQLGTSTDIDMCIEVDWYYLINGTRK